MPATDDEVMEVEDFLVDDKPELVDIPDVEKTSECISNEESAAGNLRSEGSKEGFILQFTTCSWQFEHLLLASRLKFV